MKIHISKKQLAIALHLLFWIISINGWYLVFNPGVEVSTLSEGIQDYVSLLFPVNLLFSLYCLLPFVWLTRSPRKWLKVCLTILFLIPVGYLFWAFINPGNHEDEIAVFTEYFISGFMYTVVFHLSIALAVYFNLKVLIDRYLKAGNFGRYLLYVTSLALAAAVINYALFNYIIDWLFPQFYFISYFSIPELVLIIGLYLFITTTLYLFWQYTSMLIAKRDQARNELYALKAQINPHFLFNNLNTIYSMASNNDQHTKEVILQLSDFLRYVLYDTASEYIPLEKEVEIIRSYVELQKARINPAITPVELIVEGEFGQAQIAPLLLLPLAENCFKHGKGKDPGKIAIFIELKENQLVFMTENNIVPKEKEQERENGGIGIDIVEKRLNLIYPNRHTIQYGGKDGIFKLDLSIELTKP